MPRPRAVAVLIVLLLIAVACGQKPGVGDPGGDALSAGSGAGEASGSGSTTGDAASTETTLAAGTETTVAGAAPAPGAATGGGTPAGGAAAAAAPAGDRTGISDTTITIGVHAPISGAAPLPQTSFERGAQVYWDFLKSKGGVFGRNVKVIIRDDEFNPATAKRVCSQMVEQDKVFMLVGAGGADQINTCAKYANSVGVPYFSSGVNEEGLRNLRGYFAFSMSYAAQSPMLVQWAQKRAGGGKFAIAVEDTPSFADAHASITAAARNAGLQVVYDRKIPKNIQQTDALTIANGLRTSGAQIVYIITSPQSFVNVAIAASGQGYTPRWIGPGLTSGLNLVAQIGCPGIGQANFLSPFPQLDVIDRLDPDFRAAYARFGGGNPDDLGLGLWGLNKSLGQLFLAAGKDMSRQSFVRTIESGKAFSTNVYPAVQFSASNHFGAKTAHMLQADCGSRTFKTVAEFASGF
jgi:branched-chain amino acid transport system substrate-binding protein